MKTTIKAIARLANVDIQKAQKYVRTNPLLESEIHIDEELINLKEALRHYYTAGLALKKYPKLEQHLVEELRAMLVHSVGLVARMIEGKNLPHAYNAEDTKEAVKELSRILIGAAETTGRLSRINKDIVGALHPFLHWRQRLYFEQHAIRPVAYYRAMRAKPLFMPAPAA